MLEIISGRAGSGKTAYCLEQIKNKLLAQPVGDAIILLLPEHMTYKAERELAAMLAKEGRGFCRCYVYGFRRFAYQILQETGGGLEPGLTDLGRQLLLRQLLDRRLKDKSLSAFARAAGQRGFAAELGDIINELKSYCISPELLQEIGSQVAEKDKRLSGKLQDMALIYQDFNEAMAGSYNDGKDILCKLLEKLPKSKIVQGAELWLDGFLFFNPLEKQLLQVLFGLCSQVHVSLTLDNSTLSDCQPWQNVPREDIFYRSQSTRNYLLELAGEMNMEARERFMAGGARFVSPLLRDMERQWLSHRPVPVKIAKSRQSDKGNNTNNTTNNANNNNGNSDQKDAISTHLRITEAATIRLELEAMADDIVRLVRDEGYRWRDIGILIRDEDSYGSMAGMVLQEYGIPFFSATRRKCTHHPLAELIRSALAICTSRSSWSYENVFGCLKTGFFKEPCGLLPDAMDELENYVLEFGIKGKKVWAQPEDWQFVSRYSIDEEDGDADASQLQRAELADRRRRQVAEPLLRLQETLQAAETAADMAEAVYVFLTELRVPQQLEQWAAEDEQQGNLAGAREHQQIWRSIMELLDQLAELGTGSGEPSLAEFTAVTGEGLDSLSVSMIPPGLDYVSLASFDQNSLDNLRAIYVPGANAGSMPRHSSENVILSDADRIYINQVEAGDRRTGRRLSIIGQENSYNEGYLLYKGFTQAREYLWVSYALSDDSGAGREPARLVQWLRKLVPELKLGQVLQGDGFVAEGRQALSGLGIALRHCKDYGVMEEKWQAVYNWLLIQREKNKKSASAPLAKGLTALQKALVSRMGADRLPEELAGQLFAPKGYLRGSVTRLERYNHCPFQYFAQYGLKLQERKIRGFSSPELGTLLHGVLREFGEQLKREGRRWSDVEEGEQRQLCHEILHRLAPRLQNNIIFQQKQLEIQLRRIENTANFALKRLCAFDAVSKLHPCYFEQGFGIFARDENEQAVELVYRLSNHNMLSLNGQIDRIDMTEDGSYFMVMDYKTGSASINIMDVYYGIKLQLLTYLLVAGQLLAERHGRSTVPVGMLYCFLKRPMVSLASHKESKQEMIAELEKRLKMPGWIVADEELVQLIDSSLSASGESRFIHAKLKKDGSLGKSEVHLRTERELELLLAYVEKLLQGTGEAILAGEIAPEPYMDRNGFSSCAYCGYHALCGFDAQLEGFGYKHVLRQKDVDFMKNIEMELSPEQVRAVDERLTGRHEKKADLVKADNKMETDKTDVTDNQAAEQEVDG